MPRLKMTRVAPNAKRVYLAITQSSDKKPGFRANGAHKSTIFTQ